MEALQTELTALKPHRQTDPASAQRFLELQQNLNGLSSKLGGDLPCANGAATAGSSSLRVVQPPPTGCTPTTTNFANNTSVAIPAGPSTTTSTISVSGLDTYLWDVDVRTFIQHTFSADLDITLTSPAGTIVTLTTDNGGGNDNVFDGTVWDDSANPAGQVPYTSNDGLVTDHAYANNTLASPLVPEESLAAFIGEDPNGDWTLTISDDAGGDAGDLNSWDLNLTTFPTPVITMPVQTFNQATPVPIPAGPTTVTSTLAVSGTTLPLCKVELLSDITHTFSADLEVTLSSPTGTIVTLTTDNGGGNNDVYSGTLWDDLANPAGQVPYTSNDGLVTDHTYSNATTATPLVAEESLGAFLGELADGNWTLTISDDAGGDAGQLNSWEIRLTTCQCNQADLAVSISDTPDPVTAGTMLTYTVTAANTGPGTAEDIAITMPVPAGATLVTADAGAGGSCNASSPVICSWAGATANGNSRVATVVVAVDAGQTTALNTTVVGNTTSSDPVPGNNTAMASTGVVSTADLSISKTAVGVPTPLVIGSAFSYTLDVSNAGPSSATAVVVSDPLPATLNYVSNDCGANFAAGTLTWNIGTMAPASNLSCTLNVTVASFGQIENTASINADSTDPDGANNTSAAVIAGANATPVPALAPYGLMILILLSLGVGIVAIRRV